MTTTSKNKCNYFIVSVGQWYDNYIGHEQTAYIKGQFIGINARRFLDIFEYSNISENSNQEALLLFLDFEKAWFFFWKTYTNLRNTVIGK